MIGTVDGNQKSGEAAPKMYESSAKNGDIYQMSTGEWVYRISGCHQQNDWWIL